MYQDCKFGAVFHPDLVEDPVEIDLDRAFGHPQLRADLTVSRLGASPDLKVVAPTAAFYVMPQVLLPPGRTDEDFVLGLLRDTGILVVYGSGFNMPADQGFFRIVYLASPNELSAIYDDLVAYARHFVSTH